jgi:hypothetical protein
MNKNTFERVIFLGLPYSLQLQTKTACLITDGWIVKAMIANRHSHTQRTPPSVICGQAGHSHGVIMYRLVHGLQYNRNELDKQQDFVGFAI